MKTIPVGIQLPEGTDLRLADGSGQYVRAAIGRHCSLVLHVPKAKSERLLRILVDLRALLAEP